MVVETGTPVNGLVVSRYAPNGVGDGFVCLPSQLVGLYTQQVVCQACQAVCKALMAYTTILVVPASVAGSKKCLREQIVVQLRGMYLMIGATPKSEYGQFVLKTQTNT